MSLKVYWYILLILNMMEPFYTQSIETITGEGEKVYSYSKTQNYLIKKASSTKKYFEITHFNTEYELLKGEKTIHTGEQQSNDAYYFFEHDGSDYYLNMKKGSGAGGFNIRSSDKEFSLVLTSSLELIVFTKRSFEITLQNDKNYPQLLCIYIPYVSKLVIDSAKFKENNNNFAPIEKKVRSIDNQGYSYYYFMILNSKIIINLSLSTNWYSTISQSTKAKIEIDKSQIEDISSDYVNCVKSGDIGLYTITSNSYSDYELSYSGNSNSKIYYFESNKEKTLLETNKIYSKNKNFIYVDATNSKTCFSIYFLNGKFIIKDTSTYSLVLFKSRYYDITIQNSQAKYFQVKFEKNYYINITKIELVNQKTEIKALYLNPDNYYVYQFYRTSNEMPIKIYFENTDSISDYKEIELKFFAFNEDMKIINDDYFECISTEKSFRLMSNSQNKKYLNLKTNTTKYVMLNESKAEKEQQIIMDNNKMYYLNVFGTKKAPICIYGFYSKTEVIELKKNEQIKLKFFEVYSYEFNLVEVNEGREIVLHFESNNKKTSFYSLELKGASRKDYSDIENPGNVIIIPDQKKVSIKFKVMNYDNPDEFTFWYYSEKTSDYKTLLSIAKFFAYVCFAIVVIPFLVLCYCAEAFKNNTESEEKSYFCEKFSSVYLCKKYDKIK